MSPTHHGARQTDRCSGGGDRPSRGRGRAGRKLAVGLLAAVSLAAFCGGTTASAQTTGNEVVKGEATAWSTAMSFKLVQGGAALGWSFGVSTATYRDITATAEGRALDMGSLKQLLGLPQCEGKYPPAIPEDQFPEPIIAESGTPDAADGKSGEARFPGLDGAPQGPFMGTHFARATVKPLSESRTEIEDQDFGLVRVEGATASSTTQFDNGVRKATSTSKAKRLIILGGQMEIYDPVWTATAHSGAETKKEASFDYAGISIFGNWVPREQVETQFGFFKGVWETLLSPLGMRIEFPRVTPPVTSDEGIAVSPFMISLTNAPIGRDLITPLFGSELMKDLRQRSIDEDCKRETVWTILDAVDNALGGSGAIETSIGGANATTNDTDFSFEPFPAPTAAPSTAPATSAAPPPAFDDSGSFDDLGGDYSSDFGDDFSTDFGDDFSSDFEDDFSSDFGDEGLAFDDTVAEFTDVTEPIAEVDDGDSDGEEIAASKGSTGTSAGNAAAIVVGILGLLGAVALSLGDRMIGMKNRRRIA